MATSCTHCCLLQTYRSRSLWQRRHGGRNDRVVRSHHRHSSLSKCKQWARCRQQEQSRVHKYENEQRQRELTAIRFPHCTRPALIMSHRWHNIGILRTHPISFTVPFHLKLMTLVIGSLLPPLSTLISRLQPQILLLFSFTIHLQTQIHHLIRVQ